MTAEELKIHYTKSHSSGAEEFVGHYKDKNTGSKCNYWAFWVRVLFGYGVKKGRDQLIIT